METLTESRDINNSKISTLYFRKIFYMRDPKSFKNYQIHIERDDGAIIYLNGEEISPLNRSNMPAGNITHSTLASSRVKTNNQSDTIIIDNSYMKNTNIIAVEVHQVDSNSSDIYFDLRIDRNNL